MSDLAVVLDAAGTILRMYRLANDLMREIMIPSIVTADLVLEKENRALVVPNLDPSEVLKMPSDRPLRALLEGRKDMIDIVCASSDITVDEAWDTIQASRATVSDIQRTHLAVKDKCPESYQTTGFVVDTECCYVPYIVSTGGIPFPGLQEVIWELEAIGADVYICSGDSMRSLSKLTAFGIPLNRIHAVASPRIKEALVKSLKKDRKVVMVGDGLNDVYALSAADLGVLTVQQNSNPPSRLSSSADRIIFDLKELPDLVHEFAKCTT
jgi:Cu+-exporting ATPase